MNDTGFPYKRQSQSLGQGTKRQTLGNHNRNRLSRAQQQALHVEFRSDELMQGQPPSHTAEDFQKPRLRKCPFRLDTVRWKSATKLGDGYDGCVWKVEFGNEGTFALKVFWDAQPPLIRDCYFAPQRECQNAAILQMMEAVLQERPVSLPYGHPETQAQAMANMLAFSASPEEVQQQKATEASPSAALLHCLPMRRCHGWLDFNGDLIKQMPFKIKPQGRKYDKPPHFMPPGITYHAIVYEYVPEGGNEPASIKVILQFFHLVGFSFTNCPRIENWKGGKLIDGSDIVYPWGFGWHVRYYGSPWITAALLGSDARLEEQEAESN